MGFESLQNYAPQKNKDGFDPFKGTFTCEVNYARIEVYDGEKEELKGRKRFRYQLEVLDDPEFSGRKLFKSYWLDDDEALKKLANVLWTVGLTFKSEEDLQSCADLFSKMILEVKTYHFASKENKDERIQMHLIKGLKIESDATASPSPF